MRTHACQTAEIMDSAMKITVYGEQYIYELQSTYADDPIWIKGKGERNEDGARGQCHLKSYQGQGH